MTHPEKHVVVIGAGPAGLTAGLMLARASVPVTVLEADSVVGGISRTVEREGWRFDIGGHRFFTKVPAVEQFWHEVLPDEEFLLRPRMSRIYYGGKLFDYPLRAMNALRGLGPREAVECVLSYVGARLRPPADQHNFEGWVSARFGRRLYRIFFKTYTEKVWGIPADQIQADWAAQRIKNLSLAKAIVNAVLPKRNSKDITSLIEEFQYPRLGPGQMWQEAAEQLEDLGGELHLNTPVAVVRHRDGLAYEVDVRHGDLTVCYPATDVISSMPLSTLVQVMDPPAPAHVLAAARGLRYRDFLTVAVVVPQACSFPDNWIYIHSPEARVGRIQNFRSWSPDLVKPGWTCLGLEYFVNEGDDLWSSDDEDLVALAALELDRLGLVPAGQVERGYVVRMPKAYPVYDEDYAGHVDTIREWLATAVTNVRPVGRNGMHKYNNQDHSMLTAMLSVENILGAEHDVWSVNVDDDYHEEQTSTGRFDRSGTGRDAPMLPRRVDATSDAA